MNTKLTIKYTNGNTLTQLVNYLHFESGAIFFTVDKQPHSVFQEPVRIPLEIIDTFDIEKIS